MQVQFKVNGKAATLEVPPNTLLVHALHTWRITNTYTTTGLSSNSVLEVDFPALSLH